MVSTYVGTLSLSETGKTSVGVSESGSATLGVDLSTTISSSGQIVGSETITGNVALRIDLPARKDEDVHGPGRSEQ